MPTNQRRRRANRVQLVLAIAVFAGLGAFFWYRSQALERLGAVEAYFATETGEQVGPLSLEVASTAAERRKGLMFRKPGDMARDEGMLFIFAVEEDQSFWMKNTFIALDMIFIDSSKRIVGMIHDVPPRTVESRKIGRPSLYVVELLAGEAKRRGIREGMRLVVDEPLPKGS